MTDFLGHNENPLRPEEWERINDTVIQVANYTDLNRAITEKVPGCVAQQARAGATFGATFIRRRKRPGSTESPWLVVLTPEQFATYVREATS